MLNPEDKSFKKECLQIYINLYPIHHTHKGKTPCGCDLTSELCDLNCCCDGDCTPSDRAVFSKCIDHFTSLVRFIKLLNIFTNY